MSKITLRKTKENKKMPKREQALIESLKAIIATTYSHVDGRNLLDELHPRKQLDIKRRIDGKETWFEADWLSNLRLAVKEAEKLLVQDIA